VLIGKGLYPPAVLGTSSPETQAIGIEQIRKLILGRVGYRPHEAKKLVFIVRAADELSQGAANALLKTLEEPPACVHFVLITSRPNRLLDTIRSRTLPVRFGALSDSVLHEILTQKQVDPAIIPLAQGSARLALELADSEQLAVRNQFADAILRAIEARDLADALEALGKKPDDRDELKQNLSWVQARFALLARERLESDPMSAEKAARYHRIVLETSRDLDRNGQPALMLEALVTRLRSA